jgi:hypothetical protein
VVTLAPAQAVNGLQFAMIALPAHQISGVVVDEIRPNGIRQWVRVSGVAPFQTHCVANVGLTTDFQGDVVVRPHTYPVPYAGLTVTTRGLLEPVVDVAGGALEFQAVSSLLPGVFADLEEPAWNTVPEGRRPSLRGSLPAPVLRALYRSTIGDGRDFFSFHATHVLPTFPSPNAGIVAPMTVVKGWLARSAGSGFARRTRDGDPDRPRRKGEHDAEAVRSAVDRGCQDEGCHARSLTLAGAPRN